MIQMAARHPDFWPQSGSVLQPRVAAAATLGTADAMINPNGVATAAIPNIDGSGKGATALWLRII